MSYHRKTISGCPPELIGFGNASMQSATKTDPVDLARLQLMADIELHLQSARVFLTSREKMHPCGIELHDELQARVTAAIQPEPFPQPQRRDGKEPCGECHLTIDETCDICGATR